MSRSTTLLGKTYPGRPIFGSLACQLWIMEQRGDARDAQALLDATNRINAAFGHAPVDLADDFTPLPMEGLVTVPAAAILDLSEDEIGDPMKRSKAA